MTTDPIAAKAETSAVRITSLATALWAKRPELRPSNLRMRGGYWWLGDHTVSDDDAHMLIEAACWRALPGCKYSKQTHIDGLVTYNIWVANNLLVESEDTLTEALIAACMEAKQ